MKCTSTMIAIALAGILAIAIVPVSLQKAFAHAHTELNVPASDQLTGKKISFVLGHTSEPTFGVKPGVHDGVHNMEILLSDSATKLPLTGANLKADKYYFKDIQSFNKAKTLDKADEVAKNVTVGSVFGDPGHYMIRQVQAPGIYGYHVYGTIDYFKVAQIPIDTTVFCTSTEGNTTKFNSPGWSGAFGCTPDINSIAFPHDAISSQEKGNNKDHKTAATLNNAQMTIPISYENVASNKANNPVAASPGVTNNDSSSTGLLYLLAAGLPMAGIAGVFGWRGRNKSKGD